MKSWDRFVASINRKEKDHIPVALIGTNRFYASLDNCELSDLFFYPQRMVDTQMRIFKEMPDITFIPGTWPDFGVAILSAFGCKVVWQKNMMPQIGGHVFESAESFSSFSIPNPTTDGMMVWYLKTLELFMQRKDEVEDCSHFLWSFGPGELAAYLCGTSNFFIHLSDHPGEIKALLGKVTDAIIVWLKAQQEVNRNADAMLITDDISGMISKKFYEAYLLECHQKIREAFPDFIYVLHNDTRSDHILEPLKKTGINVFNLGKSTDLQKAKMALSDKISLMGNIDPLDLMINGNPEDVYQDALSRLALFGREDGFILSVGGGTNDGTKRENIQALLKAVRDYRDE